MGVIETYSNYKPTKLQIGRQHPDPVVETASLASVEPPEVWSVAFNSFLLWIGSNFLL